MISIMLELGTAHDEFAVMPLDIQTNSLANQFGISRGEQISEFDIPKIAAGLGVDAAITGHLKSFGAVLLSYNKILVSFNCIQAVIDNPRGLMTESQG